MKIKQLANCSIAQRSLDANDVNENGVPKNYEFLKDTIFDLGEATANYLLNLKIYADGKTIRSPEGEIIPEGTLCSDFIIVE